MRRGNKHERVGKCPFSHITPERQGLDTRSALAALRGLQSSQGRGTQISELICVPGGREDSAFKSASAVMQLSTFEKRSRVAHIDSASASRRDKPSGKMSQGLRSWRTVPGRQGK